MLRWSSVVLGVVLILAVAVVTTPLAANASYTQGPIISKPLIAGQNMIAGVVEVGISGSDLCVFYDTNASWDLQETHLYVGLTPPEKAAPGKFPYKHEYLGGVDTDEFCIPIADIGASCGDTVHIAAHAVVTDCSCNEETAWACGDPIRPGRGGWAMMFTIAIPCDS